MQITESLYKNRRDAAVKLSATIEKLAVKKPLVLGVPRGGVEMAYHLANILKTDFSVIVAKKLPHPSQPEFGIGAMCEDGTTYIDRQIKIDDNTLAMITQKVKQEIERRVLIYRKGKPLPNLKNRTVILVDDGIATGSTLAAAVMYCRAKEAGKIIVAAPVSGHGFADEIYKADELVILEKPSVFYGVGQAYEDFSQLTDEEVLHFLKNEKNGPEHHKEKDAREAGIRFFPLSNSKQLDPLLERIGDSRIVLLGEATHGTHEYYTWRTAISKRLIEEKGFNFIAVEGDWPDCYKVNRYVKGYDNQTKKPQEILKSFNRWPTWMWANWEIAALTEWLKEYNARKMPGKKAGFYGLDVYSLWESLEALIKYLESNDPSMAKIARKALDCFAGYEKSEQLYAMHPMSASCKEQVIKILKEIRSKAPTYNHDPEASLNTMQNAHIAVKAEEYYSNMIRFNDRTWNIRDRHMMETLQRLLEFHGPHSKAIVWEHNTHVGDARYTDMKKSGLFNVGQLVREQFSEFETTIVGFGSYSGTVIAGEAWGAPMREMEVPEAEHGSAERIMHNKFKDNQLIIFNRNDGNGEFSRVLPHRAIGVVYDPGDERHNYVQSLISKRYDAFIYIDETHALHPIQVKIDYDQVPETYPFKF